MKVAINLEVFNLSEDDLMVICEGETEGDEYVVVNSEEDADFWPRVLIVNYAGYPGEGDQKSDELFRMKVTASLYNRVVEVIEEME